MSKNIFINPTNGKKYECILFGVHLSSGWEWFGFEETDVTKNDDIFWISSRI